MHLLGITLRKHFTTCWKVYLLKIRNPEEEEAGIGTSEQGVPPEIGAE